MAQSQFRNLPSVRWAWLAGFLLLAAWLALGDSGRDRLSPAVSPVECATATRPHIHYVTKNIEDIEVGDKVLAWDESTGGQQLQRIDKTYRRTSDHLRILTIRGGDGKVQTLRTTNEHPFWVPGRGWVNAGELTPETDLLDADGASAQLAGTKLDARPGGVLVYNVRVENFHTYYVAEDSKSSPILAHNANCENFAREMLKIRPNAVIMKLQPRLPIKWTGHLPGYPIAGSAQTSFTNHFFHLEAGILRDPANKAGIEWGKWLIKYMEMNKLNLQDIAAHINITLVP